METKFEEKGTRIQNGEGGEIWMEIRLDTIRYSMLAKSLGMQTELELLNAELLF